MTNDGHYQPHLITTFTKVDHCAAPPLSNNDDNDIPFVIALDTSWCPVSTQYWFALSLVSVEPLWLQPPSQSLNRCLWAKEMTSVVKVGRKWGVHFVQTTKMTILGESLSGSKPKNVDACLSMLQKTIKATLLGSRSTWEAHSFKITFRWEFRWP